MDPGQEGKDVTYQPTPIDTSKVQLSGHLESLAERLAENVHDVWARQRMQEGWTHGSERDDSAKTHPDLVPYSELEESEREYDRSTVRETLKVILALGYRIERT